METRSDGQNIKEVNLYLIRLWEFSLKHESEGIWKLIVYSVS